IEGLKLFREEGAIPPKTVQEATSEYRAASDKIGNFISERLRKTETNSKASDIYYAYSSWCADNGYGCENKNNFMGELKAKNLVSTTGTVEGVTYKNVVRGYEIVPVPIGKDDDIPFVAENL
ncbi:MAG: primase-like DNA-binding domain-containing protein, partial [bacterium]